MPVALTQARVMAHSPVPDAPLSIEPVGRPIIGRAAPPGSKSITNRMLLLAGLASGRSVLSGALKSDDTAHMATALRAMGVGVGEPDATGFVVEGNGRLAAPAEALLLGNAGTAMRFLTAACATADGTVVLDGDGHMRRRPIGPLVDALRRLGVRATADGGCPPVRVEGMGARGLAGGRVEIDAGLSSQYVSALLMLAPRARGPVEITLAGAAGAIGARGYVGLTLAAMRRFGARVEAVGDASWRVQPGRYEAADVAIEPDASAATYLWAAAALTGGTIDIGCAAAAFTQPDAAAAALIARYPALPAVIEGSQMQDAIPTLAVMAAFNATEVRFTGIANLRVKECDRVAALREGLCRLRPGLAREDGDDLVVSGDPALRGAVAGDGAARIDPHGDHRMAMSFALAGLLMKGVTIEDPGCVAKTWPQYWTVLRGLGVRLSAAG